MNDLLLDKVCIVTGGSRGIGKAITRVFAENGATVYAVATKEGSIEEWCGEFNETCRGQVRPLYFDISDEAAAKTAVMGIKKEQGHIDALVNNAGIEFNELIGMINTDNMKRMFDVNVFGTINMLQLVSRIMGRQPSGGSIINITSNVAIRGNAGQLVYSATKGAVISLTKSAAKELAPKKIRVNAIAPGLTDTEMMQQVDREVIQKRIDNICMGRLAEPEDIAKGCLYFASDMSEYTSGQIISIDGCTIM